MKRQGIEVVKTFGGVQWRKKVEQAIEELNEQGKRVLSIGPDTRRGIVILLWEDA